MMFTVYTHPELRRVLDLAQDDDEIAIAFPGGLPDGPYHVGLAQARVTVRHVPEPPS